MIAMESFEACNNILSPQKVLINNKQEAKRKLALGMKEVKTQNKIGETNFTTLPWPSKSLKRSKNLDLEANPTALSSFSSAIKMKKYLSMVYHEKNSPQEKKIASIQSSVSSLHGNVGAQLKTLLDSKAKEK